MPKSTANGTAKNILESVRLNAVHLAITVLDTAHLHEMHEDIVAGKVSPHLADRLERLVVLIDNTPWHTNFTAKVSELRSNIQSLIKVLKDDDTEKAKTTAGKMHGSYHSLVRDFYIELPKLSSKRPADQSRGESRIARKIMAR